jgi:hypothetical protein
MARLSDDDADTAQYMRGRGTSFRTLLQIFGCTTRELKEALERQPEPAAAPQPAPVLASAAKSEPPQPARKRTFFNSYPHTRRRPTLPAQRQAEQEQIERHLQEKGVTKCPPTGAGYVLPHYQHQAAWPKARRKKVGAR